jgi:hypothetical protein
VQNIALEYKRFESGELIAPEAGVISRLPDDCFSIWIVDQLAARAPLQTDERPHEEKILEM